MKIVKMSLVNSDTVIDILKAKFPTSSNFEYKKIQISEVYPSSLHVYTKRLNHARKMNKLCFQHNIPLGAPYLELYEDHTEHLVVPPIIECRHGIYLLCDGMHRVYTFRELGIKEMFGIVIHQTGLPLAGDINSWNNVSEKATQLPVEKNFINFNPNGLTGYSKFCNSNYFWRKRISNPQINNIYQEKIAAICN